MLSFSHEMSWMRSGTELCQFLKIFSTYSCTGQSKAKRCALDLTQDERSLIYSRTSVARTLMARLPRLFRTHS